MYFLVHLSYDLSSSGMCVMDSHGRTVFVITVKVDEVTGQWKDLVITSRSKLDKPMKGSTNLLVLFSEQAFKRLLKEDSVDYATYTANVPTKKRASRGQSGPGDHDGAQANGHTASRAAPRRKSTAAAAEYGGDSDDDGSDEDWGDKSKRRKSAPGGRARGRGKRQSL